MLHSLRLEQKETANRPELQKAQLICDPVACVLTVSTGGPCSGDVRGRRYEPMQCCHTAYAMFVTHFCAGPVREDLDGSQRRQRRVIPDAGGKRAAGGQHDWAPLARPAYQYTTASRDHRDRHVRLGLQTQLHFVAERSSSSGSGSDAAPPPLPLLDGACWPCLFNAERRRDAP